MLDAYVKIRYIHPYHDICKDKRMAVYSVLGKWNFVLSLTSPVCALVEV